MKIEITIKWGVASSITSIVYNDWSMEKLHYVVRQVLDLFEVNKK